MEEAANKENLVNNQFKLKVDDSKSDTNILIFEIPTIQNESHRKKEKKKVKNNGVKQPMNAFMLWCKEKRSLVHNFYKIDSSNASFLLGQAWKQLTDDEKRPYFQKAKEIKNKHKLDYPEFSYKLKNPRKSHKFSDWLEQQKNIKNQEDNLFITIMMDNSSYSINQKLINNNVFENDRSNDDKCSNYTGYKIDYNINNEKKCNSNRMATEYNGINVITKNGNLNTSQHSNIKETASDTQNIYFYKHLNSRNLIESKTNDFYDFKLNSENKLMNIQNIDKAFLENSKMNSELLNFDFVKNSKQSDHIISQKKPIIRLRNLPTVSNFEMKNHKSINDVNTLEKHGMPIYNDININNYKQDLAPKLTTNKIVVNNALNDIVLNTFTPHKFQLNCNSGNNPYKEKQTKYINPAFVANIDKHNCDFHDVNVKKILNDESLVTSHEEFSQQGIDTFFSLLPEILNCQQEASIIDPINFSTSIINSQATQNIIEDNFQQKLVKKQDILTINPMDSSIQESDSEMDLNESFVALTDYLTKPDEFLKWNYDFIMTNNHLI